MIIVMKANTPEPEIERVSQVLQKGNVLPEKIIGKQNTVIGLVGDTAALNLNQIQNISSFIEKVMRIDKPFKRAALEFHNGQPSTVFVETPNGFVAFGQDHPVVKIAGPCSVENEDMIIQTALRVKASGAMFLRGGAYKPRTSPYSFQGHGKQALQMLSKAREVANIGIVTEVMDSRDLEAIEEVADIIQIGARNMQNFALLKQVGKTNKAILLKRGLSATIEDWLMAAEYILAEGNPNIILCERGIRTFDRQYTRNTLDLSAIPVLRGLTHLPIMIDPSHGTGRAEYVPLMAKAAIAAGTDSLMLEVHPTPAQALSDGAQSLTLEQYDELTPTLSMIEQAIGGRTQTVPSLVPTLSSHRDGAAA